MLESSVVFLPRLRGTAQRAISPRRNQACKGESEVLVFISSTNTSRFSSVLHATITLQAALSHSSRSSAPKEYFLAEAQPFEDSPYTESLRLLPISCSKKWRLSETVAAGRFCTSSSRSFWVVWSTFGGLCRLPFLEGFYDPLLSPTA